MHYNGLPLISFEGRKYKESIPAVTYAREALRREVHERLALYDTAKISGDFVNLEAALVYALECVYTLNAWESYLRAAGYHNASKQEAEIYINACAAKFVCIVLHPLMASCRDYTSKWKAGIVLKRIANELSDILDLSAETLSRYPLVQPLYTFRQFQQDYPNVLRSLYSSL